MLGRPPHIPNEDHVHNLEKPLDKSDLQSRVNELNKWISVVMEYIDNEDLTIYV